MDDHSFRTRFNFARLVSVLDLLCFIIPLQDGFVASLPPVLKPSILAPDVTPASEHLRAWYALLRRTSGGRPRRA